MRSFNFLVVQSGRIASSEKMLAEVLAVLINCYNIATNARRWLFKDGAP